MMYYSGGSGGNEIFYNECVFVDIRTKKMIDKLTSLPQKKGYSVKFVDLEDTFWFDTKHDVQSFLNDQTRERYGIKSRRKGYFDYINDHSEVLRYYVTSINGNLVVEDQVVVGVSPLA